PRYRSGDADGFRVLEVRVDRRNHDARFDRNQIDSDQRNSNPRVDHDSLVEYAIEYINQRTATWGAFNGHSLVLEIWSECTRRGRKLRQLALDAIETLLEMLNAG